MKIAIMTDMEGVAGVLDHDNWVMPDGRYYMTGRDLLTEEVNAAARGFFAAGASEILVIDGHGAGGINQLLLDARTKFQRGFYGPYPCGIDKSFDAVAWVGQHAKSESAHAHIAHTGWFNVYDYQLNGVSIGEFGQFAYCAAELGVPSIFGSGDLAFTKEARALVPGIETVSVKEGLTPAPGHMLSYLEYREYSLAAVHLHPYEACGRIEAGAERALKRLLETHKNQSTFFPPKLVPPYTVETNYRSEGDLGETTARASSDIGIADAFNRAAAAPRI